MRLIDGDELKRKAQKVATDAWKMKLKGNVETILNQFIDWIDVSPTIEIPEQKTWKWIPVSERLPELNQICIVTDETRRCAYEYGLHGETYDEENGWTYLGHRIVAWMPLPEAYKGE